MQSMKRGRMVSFVPIAVICGIVAASPGIVLLIRVQANRTKAGMGKAIACLIFSFVLLTMAIAIVSGTQRENLLLFSIWAVGTFLALYVIASISTFVRMR